MGALAAGLAPELGPAGPLRVRNGPGPFRARSGPGSALNLQPEGGSGVPPIYSIYNIYSIVVKK